MVVTDKPQLFGIAQWVALNSQNYNLWKKAAGDEPQRMAILCKALRGHLACMARQLNPESAQIANEATIFQIDQAKKMHWHGTPLVAFHVVGSSRLIPPEGLGMGRMTAFGFGEICNEITYGHLLECKRHHQEMAVL